MVFTSARQSFDRCRAKCREKVEHKLHKVLKRFRHDPPFLRTNENLHGSRAKV